MPQFHDLVASVVIDGNPLPEYDIDINEEAREITCYVPSEAGKEFAIQWKDLKRPRRATSGSVNLDGIRAGSTCILEHDCGPRGKPYSASLDLSKQIAEDETDVAPNQLGEVKLTISLLRKWKVLSTSHSVLHETSSRVRTFRALLNSEKFELDVRHGEDTTKIPRRIIGGKRYGDRLATFIFRYRALGFLQAHGIAPRPPSAPQCEQQSKKRTAAEQDIIYIKEDDEGDDDDQQLERLKTEIKRIEARRSKRQKITTKAESKPIIITNEVIDLT